MLLKSFLQLFVEARVDIVTVGKMELNSICRDQFSEFIW